MEELEKFDRALRLVERYESYLFQRALGIVLIICGITFPLTAFLVMKAQSMAELLDMSTEAFLAFVPTIILLIGTATIIYSFTSAHVVTSRMRKTSVWKDAPHMILMFMIWFVSFYITSYVPEPYTLVSWLWAGGFASLISYLVLKREQSNWNYPELLVIGVICLLASLPMLVIKEMQMAETFTLLVFSVSFIAGGTYSFSNASKVLNEGDRQFNSPITR